MRTPTAIVLGLLTMQPQLQAEESILAANRVAMGSGSLKKEDAASLARSWSSTAQPDAAPAKPDPGVLMAAGIRVRRVRRRTKTAPTP